MIVLADTGPLVALLDRNDRWHRRVRRYLSRYRGSLITTWPVLTEAASLCGADEQIALFQMVESGAIEIAPQTAADAARVKWYLAKYRDRGHGTGARRSCGRDPSEITGYLRSGSDASR